MLDVTKHKQLFLDDYAIESMEGVKRTLHQPDKQGPVLRADVDAGQTAVQSRNSPQWNSDKELWEWFYWSYYEFPPYGPHATTERRTVCYATSTDLIHWQKPSLGLYEWDGSTDNNICYRPELVKVDEWGNYRYLYHTYRDEAEPDPSRRYKAMFDHADRWLGVSPDGLDWTMLDIPPIPSQDESHLFFDETTRQFTLTHKLPTEWGRSVWMSRSPDFENWSEPVLVFHTDEVDRENRRKRIEAVMADSRYLAPPLFDGVDYIAETYQMAVMPYEGVYVGFPRILNPSATIPPPYGNFTALNQTELAVSRDLLDWERVADRALFLEIDPWDGVSFDTTQVSPVGRPIVRDDEIWVFYGSHRYRGPQEFYEAAGHDYQFERGAMSLAKLRLDGFVSLDADREGVVVTKPFVASEGSLLVNADASRGRVDAELLDAESMEPVNGLSGTVTRDGIDAAVVEGVSYDRPLRARFTLKDASLYAFWIK